MLRNCHFILGCDLTSAMEIMFYIRYHNFHVTLIYVIRGLLFASYSLLSDLRVLVCLLNLKNEFIYPFSDYKSDTFKI